MADDIEIWEPAPKQKKAKRSGAGAGAYLTPWIGGGALIPLGWAAHAAWGDAGLTTGLAAAAVAAAGSAATWVSWRLCRARTWYAALMAPSTVGGASAWMATVTVAGVGRPWVDLLIVGGGLLATVANVHTWQRGQGAPRGKDSVWDRPLPTWDEVAEVVGLRGTRMRVKEDSELRRVGTVQLRPGDTVESIQSSLSAIASAMRLPRRSVRAVEDPDDCSRAEVTIVKRDVLRDPIEWHALGEEEVGRSIADGPLELGTYEDGILFTDDLYDHHTLTVGMSGSGKSTYAKLKLIKVAACRDAAVLAVDVAKGRQTLGPVENAILWPAYTMKDARALLKALKRAVTDRANFLGSKGLANWERGCGLTFLHVLLEEAAQLVDVEELVTLGQLARSAGIHLEASLQRATYTNIDTDARSNFSSRICLGTADEADAGKVLPEYVIDAGAAPEQWADRQQGCAYAAVKSAPKERHAIPLRFYNASNADLKEAADALPDQDGKLDPVTRAAFGEAYAAYLAAGQGADPEPEELPAVDADPIEIDADDYQDEAVSAHEPELEGVDIDDPITMDGVRDFALPAPAPARLSRAECVRALEAVLNRWEAQGHRQFGATDLREALKRAGADRSRPWVHGELKRLTDSGRLLHHDGGLFEIVTTRELTPA